MNQNVPAPIPPWLRPVQSPMVQNIVGDDTIGLDTDCSYINQTTHQAADAPYVCILPNGNYLRQIKRIFIVGSTQATTAPFTITGTFSGFVSLKMGITLGTSAIIEWDGTAWQWLGGNATQSQS